MASKWESLAAQKRDAVNSLIPAEWRIPNPPSREEQKDVTGKYIHQFLTPKEIQITETDAFNLSAMLQMGQLTSVETTKAFCHRAALAHQLTNCLLEIFFDTAVKQAEKYDEYFATHKRPVGPLHGLPISLKDQFHLAGVETTMGYVGWIDTFQGEKGTGNEKVFESEMVKELVACGAVLFCKTSVPHTLMAGESVNNIMGYVWNPKNRLLSAGGSSGGEGALIGLRGSPLGFGTDIGGSIRIPAGFNGLYGLRPSVGRLPYEGMANSMDGQTSVLSVVGPLATSVHSIQLVVKSLLSQQPWYHDPNVINLPWRSELEQQILSVIRPPGTGPSLCFGVIRHDGAITPHPPVSRAVETVVATLQKLGHNVIDWKPTPTHDVLGSIAAKTWVYDGGADVHHSMGLAGEPLSPLIKLVYGAGPTEEMKASHIAKVNRDKRAAQKAYMEFWNSTATVTGTGRPVDAVICPLAPFAAARPDTYTYVGYTIWANVLDYTSVVLPVTVADKNIDKKDENFKPVDDHDATIYSTYDAEIFDGAHVSLQLVGRRLEEEKMLALAGYLGTALHGGA